MLRACAALALVTALAVLLWRGDLLPFALCVYKTVAPLDQYSRSGRSYANVSAVAAALGSGWLSATLPTDKANVHTYTRHYDSLLAPYQTDARAVLEIGVKKGGSLKLWREFFGASTRVIGIDTDRAGPTFPRDANVKVLALDSTDADAVRAALGSEPFLSVIVDDGCHLLKCIWKTFAATYPLLLDDGIYLVEDFPAYGLAPNGALAEASRRLLVERRVCEDTWCARRSLRGAAGRRRACVLPDAVPTERLVAILPPRSRAACPTFSSLR